MADGNLTLQIKVSMDSSQATTGFGIMDGVMMGIGQKLVDLAQRAVEFGARMAYALGVEAVTAASNLEEQTNKFNVVFRGMTDQAMIWSQTLVDAYAMSTRESRQYLASVMDLLKPMGVLPELAGQMSFEIVKLAADLGSFNNLPTSDVMLDMMSALVGNYETMKSYGIVLNETTVKQQAMNMGFEVGTGVLDPAIKAQAAYALMVKGSTDAIGDLERSSDSYANTVKKMQAVWEDLLVQGGENLMPVIRDLFLWLIDLATIAMPYVDAASATISSALRSLFEWIRDDAMPVLIGLYLKIAEKGPWESLLSILDFVARSILIIWYGLTQDITQGFGDLSAYLTSNMLEMFSWIEKNVAIGLDKTWLKIQNMIIYYLNVIRIEFADFLEKEILPAVETLDIIFPGIEESFMSFYRTIKDGFIEPIKDDTREFYEFQGNSLEEFTYDNRNHLLWAFEQIGGEVSDFFSDVGSTGAAALDNATGAVDTATKDVKDKVADVVDFMKFKGSGGSGADAAEGWGSTLIDGMEETQFRLDLVLDNIGGNMLQWISETYDRLTEANAYEGYQFNQAQANMLQEYYRLWQEAGKDVADAYAEAFRAEWEEKTAGMVETMQSTIDAMNSMIMTGSYTESGVSWNGHFYSYNAQLGEWGYQGWQFGLPHWVSAPGSFYDEMGIDQALTGGLIDLVRGVLPSFQAGGKVPIMAHAGEVVIPTASSGYDYQGLQVDSAGNVKKKKDDGGINIHFHGFFIDADGVYNACRKVGPMLRDMIDRRELQHLGIRG